MQYTENYHLKKPQMSDFASVEDISDNMDTIDEELANPSGDGAQMPVTFSDDDLDSGITDFPSFLTKIVSGMKMAKFLRDLKAGMAYVLHVGSLVNNATCTESGKALDARMGKTLQDQITSLNDSLTTSIITISLNCTNRIEAVDQQGYYVILDWKNDARFTGYTHLIPLAARKSGYTYICEVAVEGDIIRVQSAASLTDVRVSVLGIKF